MLISLHQMTISRTRRATFAAAQLVKWVIRWNAVVPQRQRRLFQLDNGNENVFVLTLFSKLANVND
jgi:hypothetical protein